VLRGKRPVRPGPPLDSPRLFQATRNGRSARWVLLLDENSENVSASSSFNAGAMSKPELS